MEKEQEQQERRCLPMGAFELGDTVQAYNWRERSAAEQVLEEDLWGFFRKASWFVRVWPYKSLLDLVKNPELDDRYEVPVVTRRERNGTLFCQFEINNARFSIVIYPRRSPVLLYHSGNGFHGYIEFAWGVAPVQEEK